MFIGFRYEVGTDYKIYLSIQNLISRLPWNQLTMVKWEYGALAFFKVTSIIFKDPKIIFVMLSLFTLFPIYKVNKIYSYKYLPYSIATFCFIFLPFSMNGMRQSIAMSFIILTVVCMLKDKKILTIISFLMAFMIHNTALIFLPYIIIAILFRKKNPSKYILLLTSIISILILFFGNKLIEFGFIENYSGYLQNVNAHDISWTALLFHIPILLLIFFFNKEKNKDNNLLNSFVISGIILDVIGTSAKYLSRISLYFTFFEILYIPIILDNIKDHSNKNIIKIMYMIYLIIYFILQFYVIGKHEIFPYKTWLFMG